MQHLLMLRLALGWLLREGFKVHQSDSGGWWNVNLGLAFVVPMLFSALKKTKPKRGKNNEGAEFVLFKFMIYVHTAWLYTAPYIPFGQSIRTSTSLISEVCLKA